MLKWYLKLKTISQTESQLQKYIYAVLYTSTSDNTDNIASLMLTSSVWWFNWEVNIQGGEKTAGKQICWMKYEQAMLLDHSNRTVHKILLGQKMILWLAQSVLT